MTFKGELIINAPQEQVAHYFADPAYLGEYQEGFIKKELISGTVGEKGAVSKLYYKFGMNDVELTETITANHLPNSFESHYHHKHMDNTMKCRFVQLEEQKTRYEYEFNYTRIRGFMPKLISILFPGMYRKQGEQWLHNFKAIVEQQ